MARRTTIRSYSERIARVIDAIHGDPDRPAALADMAAIACLSPYHFHRIYRAIAGETPEETRRRLLLHRAAGDLIRESADIARIARRAGYGSVAAFTRAFAADYGRPPAAYRRTRRHQTPAKPSGEAAMYTVDIINEPPRRLVGLEHRGDYQSIGKSFERAAALAYGSGLSGLGGMVGIYYDDPDSVPAAQLRAFAAIEIAAPAVPDNGLEVRTIPGGRAASVVHRGPYAELPRAYQYLFREWLPASGCEPADIPCYEVYLNDPRALPPSDWLTRIVLPLKP